MGQKDELSRIMDKYGNSIYRMSYYMLQNEQDAQDILQETLIKYMQKAPIFKSKEHEKAWVLRVANNLCKDMLRFQKKNRYLSLDEIREIEDGINANVCQDILEEGQSRAELIAQIFSLNEKYKKIIFLHYYEDYSVKEIASILCISEAAVKKRLERGRSELKKRILKQ